MAIRSPGPGNAFVLFGLFLALDPLAFCQELRRDLALYVVLQLDIVATSPPF